MKKTLIILLTILICAGIAATLYVPKAGDAYPKDCTMEVYEENVDKNTQLIVQALRDTNKPTLEEAMVEYERVASSIEFYPTPLEVYGEAATLFSEENKIPILREWRQERFMNKNYPNAMAYLNEYEAASRAYAENGEPIPKRYQTQDFKYKDGGVVQIGSGGMSVQYANQ